ncbi:MAG: hypothetical protein K6G26_09505 [Lachnospiraceae bacterium]|nr:hypothetical protein [Lachnospiraceae bacterium]
MGFRIAVGTSDGVNINLKFGEAKTVTIYEVDDDYNYKLLETRNVNIENGENCNKEPEEKCSSSGCNSNRGGCGGAGAISEKVQLLSDCRCVIFTKVGFQAMKQFEKKAISVFDIDIEIDKALEKIIAYYKKVNGKR